MTSLHSLLTRLQQLRTALEREAAPFVPASEIARRKAEVDGDITVLEGLIEALADEAERQERAA